MRFSLLLFVLILLAAIPSFAQTGGGLGPSPGDIAGGSPGGNPGGGPSSGPRGGSSGGMEGGAAPAYGARRTIRVALTKSSTVSSTDIVPDMTKQCPNVAITLDAKTADFTMEASETVKTDLMGPIPGLYKFTLFSQGGTTLFSTSAPRVDKAVKDVCVNLKKRS